MAQRKGTLDRFQPVKGLVTEASESNFPQDAAYDLDNVEITNTGITQRRLGLDKETSGTTLLSDFTELDRSRGVFSTHLWPAVTGEQLVDLRIIQVGEKIKVFYDLLPLSSKAVVKEFSLNDSGITVGSQIKTPCQYADSAGFVIITNQNANPVALTVDTDATGDIVVEVTPLQLEIRTQTLLDPWDDAQSYGLALTSAEEFNLRNAGWPFEAECSQNKIGSSVVTADPLLHYYEKRDWNYPGHAVLYNAMKLSTADTVAGVGAFSPWEDQKINFGETVPPLGRFVHSAYTFDSFELINAVGLPINTTGVTWTITTRPTCCMFLNGHAIYGDIDENGKTRILVSQIARETEDLQKCYQAADPTAEEINDLVATDGFVTRPLGMGRPLAMRTVNEAAVILCSNGVWVMKGVGDVFSATNFEVTRVGSVRFNSPSSVVAVNDALIFCADKGIYSLSPNEYGELKLNNLTETTIKTLYQEYGQDRINKSTAAYVEDDNYIYWLIPDEGTTVGAYTAEGYDVLVLNLTLGGFFTYSFSREEGRPALHLPLNLTSGNEVDVDEPITTSDGTTVTTTGGVEDVTVARRVRSKDKDSIAFLASYRPSGAIDNFVATLDATPLQDWVTLGSPYTTDYTSYVEFAYVYPESMLGGVEAPYVQSFFEKGRVVPEPFPPLGGAGEAEEFARLQQTYLLILEDLDG